MKDGEVNNRANAEGASEEDEPLHDTKNTLSAQTKSDDAEVEELSYLAYQEDIASLNSNEDDNSEVMTILTSDTTTLQTGIDEKAPTLMPTIDAESLQRLFFVGINPGENTASHATIENLCSGVPVKVCYQADQLSSPIVLLIKPTLTPQNRIHLTVIPYLKVSQPLTNH